MATMGKGGDSCLMTQRKALWSTLQNPSFPLPSPSEPEPETVKTVLLLRHAKSSWDNPRLTDFERPLAPRGRKAAPRMGRFMFRNGLVPDRVLCSGARRAVETLELASETWEESVQREIRDEIYHGSTGSLLEMIHGLPPEETSVLLVGHNPTFEDFAHLLAGSGEELALHELGLKYPTGALAILDFDIDDWEEVGAGRGFLRGFIRPRTLR